MTAEATALAGASLTSQWHAIDWQAAQRHVRRLQMRIAKATREQRYGKVKALQYLLTRSFYAKALAIKHVTQTPGRHTPGIDGVVWKTPAQKMHAVLRLRHRGYRAYALRRVYIPKQNGKGRRALGIPTKRDRAMQRLHAMALDPVAETKADPNSYGFRSYRSTADAIQQCFIDLARKGSAPWILEGDIRACFDKISHEWLCQNIPMPTKILRQWLKAGYIEQDVFHETESGSPQGGPVSPVLANMTLDGMEQAIAEVVTQTDKVNFVRYCDDFIATGASREVLETKVKPAIEAFLNERGLELSRDKTRIMHIADGFDFLGFNVRKYASSGGSKLLIKPSKQNVKGFLAMIRREIKSSAGLKTEALIWHLNRKIDGWANYYRHSVAKEIFAAVDKRIFEMLWRWARRRHPNKNAHWIRAKYFRSQGGGNWVFSARTQDKRGAPIWVDLHYCARVRIRRHVKIRARATPYDPAYQAYFAQRKQRKVVHAYEPAWF